MDFEIEIAHSVEEVGQEAWDRLGSGHPFSSHRWYRYGEVVLADNIPIYIILSRHGEPVARATFWLRRREQIPIPSRVARRLVEAIIRRWPLLVCQSPLVEASGLILPDPPLRDAALRTIAQVALEQAECHNISFLGYTYLEEQETSYPGWPETCIVTGVPEPFTRLDITWPDFESYYNDLSKSTRAQYRQNCNRAADLGIEISRRRMTPPLDDETLDLAVGQIWSVEAHHKTAPTPWARRLLEFGGMVDGVWLKAEIGGRMVGNFTVFGDGGIWKMTMLGRDYEVRYAYFRLIYEAIRCAIDEKARVLWGGSGVYDMKQKLGFRLVYSNRDIVLGAGSLFGVLGRLLAGLAG